MGWGTEKKKKKEKRKEKKRKERADFCDLASHLTHLLRMKCLLSKMEMGSTSKGLETIKYMLQHVP